MQGSSLVLAVNVRLQDATGHFLEYSGCLPADYNLGMSARITYRGKLLLML